MSPREMQDLERTLIDWLPARDFTYDRQSFKRALATYKDVTVEDLRANLFAFVREIAAVGRGGGRAPRHPSRRSGFPDLRAAARHVDRRGRAQALRRRPV